MREGDCRITRVSARLVRGARTWHTLLTSGDWRRPMVRHDRRRDVAAVVSDAMDVKRFGGAFSRSRSVNWDIDTGELRWARAGHPPPLVITPQRGADVNSRENGPVTVTYLDDAQGTVLGVRDPPPFTEGRTVLAPGASVLLYTDGLVERRGETIDEGLDRLTAAGACADSTPAA